jgi:hypothetical protein
MRAERAFGCRSEIDPAPGRYFRKERMMQTRTARRRFAALAVLLLGTASMVAIGLLLQGPFASPSLAADADGGASDGGFDLARPSIYRSVWQSANNDQLRAILQHHAQIRQPVVFEGFSAQASGYIEKIFLFDENLGRELLRRLAGRPTAEQIGIAENIKQTYMRLLGGMGPIFTDPAERHRVAQGLTGLFHLVDHFVTVRRGQIADEDVADRLRAERKNQKKK